MASLYQQSSNPKKPVFFAYMTFNRETSSIFDMVILKIILVWLYFCAQSCGFQAINGNCFINLKETIFTKIQMGHILLRWRCYNS